VKLEALNDGGVPANAVAQYQKAASEGRIDLLYPGLVTGEALAVLPQAAAHGVLSISSAQGSQLGVTADFPQHFVTGPGIDRIVQLMVERLKADTVNDVALLFSDDASGHSLRTSAEKYFGEAGITIAGTRLYDPAGTDLTAPVSGLKSSGAKALVYEGLGTAVFNVLAAVDLVGWDVKLFGGITAATSKYEGNAPKSVLGRLSLWAFSMATTSRGGLPESLFTPMLDGVRSVGFDYQSSGADQSAMAFAWDTIWLWKAAAETAHSLDTGAISKVLRSTTFKKGSHGLLSYDYSYSATSNFVNATQGDFTWASPYRKQSLLITSAR
jgi:branched-chain amino acid transport system substrate-binding protein